MKLDTLAQVIEILNGRERADGCQYCAFQEKEEWEMPCCKCRRNCKDYWRLGGEE